MGSYVLKFTDDAGQPLTDTGLVSIAELFLGDVLYTSPVDASGFTGAFPFLSGILYSVATSSALVPVAAFQPSASEIITISPASAARAAAIIGKGTGPPINPGATAGEVTFVQSVAANVWAISHSLGYAPAVTTIDTTGLVILGEVEYPSLSSVTITFSQPVAGTAYLV